MSDALRGTVVVHIEDALPYHLLAASERLKKLMHKVFMESVGQDALWQWLCADEEFQSLMRDNLDRQTQTAKAHFNEYDYPRHAAETLRIVTKLLSSAFPILSKNCPLNDGEDLTRLLEVRLKPDSLKPGDRSFHISSWNEDRVSGVLNGREHALHFTDKSGRKLTLKQLGECLLRPHSSGGHAPFYLQYEIDGVWTEREEIAAGLGIVHFLLEVLQQYGRMVITQSCGIKNPQRDTLYAFSDAFWEDVALLLLLQHPNILIVRAAGNHFDDPLDNKYNTGQTGVRAAMLANIIAVGVGDKHHMYASSTASHNATDFCTEPGHGWRQTSYAAPRVAALNAFLMDEFRDIPSQYIKLAQLLSCRAYNDAKSNAAGMKWSMLSGAGYLEIPEDDEGKLHEERARGMPCYQLLQRWREMVSGGKFPKVGFAELRQEQAPSHLHVYDQTTGSHSLSFAAYSDVNPLSVSFWMDVRDQAGNPVPGDQLEVWLESPSGTRMLFKGTHTEAGHGQFSTSGFAMESATSDLEGVARSWTLHIHAPEHCQIQASLSITGVERAKDISQVKNPLMETARNAA